MTPWLQDPHSGQRNSFCPRDRPRGPGHWSPALLGRKLPSTLQRPRRGSRGPMTSLPLTGHPRKMKGGENRNQPHTRPPMALSQYWKCEVVEPKGPTVPNCPPSRQRLTRGCSQRQRYSNRAQRGTEAGLKPRDELSYLTPPITS